MPLQRVPQARRKLGPHLDFPPIAILDHVIDLLRRPLACWRKQRAQLPPGSRLWANPLPAVLKAVPGYLVGYCWRPRSSDIASPSHQQTGE